LRAVHTKGIEFLVCEAEKYRLDRLDESAENTENYQYFIIVDLGRDVCAKLRTEVGRRLHTERVVPFGDDCVHLRRGPNTAEADRHSGSGPAQRKRTGTAQQVTAKPVVYTTGVYKGGGHI